MKTVFKKMLSKMKQKSDAVTFFSGFTSGACIMSVIAMVAIMAHPLYIIEFAFDGLSAPGLSRDAEDRVEDAAARFVEALVLAEEYHVNETLDDEVVNRMLDTALGELDPYSGYLDASTTQAMTAMGQEAETPRLGVTVMDIDGRYIIESVMPGGPAENVGLMPGDCIVRVGDRYVGDEAPRSVNRIIQEEIKRTGGEKIHLGVRRSDRAEEISIDIDPEPVRVIGVHDLGRENGIAHIHLERFYEGAAEDLANAIRREQRQGGLEGIVLDLRNNGGGLTTEARAIAGLFLPKGSLLYEMSGRVIGVETVRSDVEPEFPDLRLSLVVNGYTASSSEILAGAIQAHDRGKVVGWQTLGKGSIQRVYPVEDGSVKITVAEYRDGGLRKINHIGITPDIPIVGEDPKFMPSRFSEDEARDRARKSISALPYVASQ
jgi:carboxyl-terminal processing protease